MASVMKQPGKKKKWSLVVLPVICIATICVSIPVQASEFEDEPVEEPRIITAFADFDVRDHYLYYDSDDRPTLDELVSEMPQQLEVYLDDSTEPVPIDVSWYDICEDYEEESAYYYQFSPTWDEKQYDLAEGIDVWTEAPYIGVFLAPRTDEVKLSTSTVSGNPNEIAIFHYAVDIMHVNKGVACGILANIERESGFNPLAEYVEKSGAVSYGICQWNNERLEALKSYSGMNYSTLNGQLQYLYHEMQTTEKNAWSKIKACANSANGAYDSAYNWARYFERCISSEYVTRGNLARDKYWPEYQSMDNNPKNTWIQDDVGWRWVDDTGQIVKNKWVKDGGQWHYLNSNGYMAINAWARDSHGWCWLDANGLLVKNKWIKVGAEWYYLNTSGYRLENAWAKDSYGWCWLGTDGRIVKSKWIKDDGYWYYLKTNGYMAAHEWTQDRAGKCWVNSSGKIVKKKWIKTGGYWYYLNARGYMAKNTWAKDSTGWCWLGTDGKIVKNKWIKSGGYWYYLKSNGYMAANEWAKDSKRWYWMGSNGKIEQE